jgi:hypothetical protein
MFGQGGYRGLSPAEPQERKQAAAPKADPSPQELSARVQNLIDLQQYAEQADAIQATNSTTTTTPSIQQPFIAPPLPPKLQTPHNTERGLTPSTMTRGRTLTGASSGDDDIEDDDGLMVHGQLLFPKDFPKPPPPEQNPLISSSLLTKKTTKTTSDRGVSPIPLVPPIPTEPPPATAARGQPLYPRYGAVGGAHQPNEDTLMQQQASSLSASDPDRDDLLYEDDEHDYHYASTSSCGLFDSLWNCISSEALHRSFCYGSIDGMLTGAGIVACFLGMGVLTHLSSLTTKLFVITFCFCVGTADALCLCCGHVWNTYCMTLQSASERRTTRQLFENSRADAKGKLVDLLLSRGMLKIDAMSIADTLEGYPDVFVSALVGDNSGYALGDEPLKPHTAPEGTLYAAAARAQARSYGSIGEWDYDPESAGVRIVMNESRLEGVIMMLAFALGSVLPSLIYVSYSLLVDESKQQGSTASVKSLTMSTNCFIMLLLGVWKR